MADEKFLYLHHSVDSYSNTISEWAMAFSYGNFNLTLPLGPKALGRQTFILVGKFLEVKKFSYLKLGPFLNPIFPIIFCDANQ